MNAIFDMLSGRKTHITAITMAAIAILEGPLGFDVPGIEVQQDWLSLLLAAATTTSFRSALSKLSQKY